MRLVVFRDARGWWLDPQGEFRVYCDKPLTGCDKPLTGVSGNLCH